MAGEITSLAFSFHSFFLMASRTNLCCSFLDKFMLNPISAISISCLFRMSCFCFTQPCGVNLSYEIQMSSSCFLSCNTSLSSSHLFVGSMDCAKFAGGTRGLRGRLVTLASSRATSNPFVRVVFLHIVQCFQLWCSCSNYYYCRTFALVPVWGIIYQWAKVLIQKALRR